MDSRPISARPNINFHLVWRNTLDAARDTDDWHLAYIDGVNDVSSTEIEPSPSGPHAGKDLHVPAVYIHIHAGAVSCRPGYLLGMEQYSFNRSAMGYHAAYGS